MDEALNGEGVTFHEGTPFTADDVIYSLERTDEVPNSPAPVTDRIPPRDARLDPG